MRKIWLWWCKISQTHTWRTCKHLSLKISAVRYFFCQSMSPQLPSVICCLSRRKKGGRTVPENGNACPCCCLRLAVGALSGLDRYLHLPPSLPRWQQKQDEKQDGKALISFFFSAAGKRCSLWVPLAWCPRLPCLLLWPGSAFHLSSSNKKNAFFLLSPDQISIEEKLVTY